MAKINEALHEYLFNALFRLVIHNGIRSEFRAAEFAEKIIWLTFRKYKKQKTKNKNFRKILEEYTKYGLHPKAVTSSHIFIGSKEGIHKASS